MTPTDINPARFTPTADTNAVRGTSSKSGSEEGNEGDAGFRDLLKRIADDTDQPRKKATDANARGKETGGAARTRLLDAKMLAELRNRQQKDPDARDLDADATEVAGEELASADVATLDDEAPAAATGEASAKDIPGTPSNAVAMLMSLAHKAQDHTPRTSTTQAGEGTPMPNGGSDEAAAAVADKALREVQVVSVKVETHFAAVHTDNATTGFAQRLAMAQISGGAAQPGKGADAVAAKPSGQPTGEATAVSGSEKSGEVRQSRGQMFAARGERHGAETAGAGAGKAGGEAKAPIVAPNAAPAERSASANANPLGEAGVLQTPFQQLSNRLLATAHELQQAASATPASTAGTDPAASAPVRVLSINLHPEELGSVTVRMSMVAGSLDVQIDAEMPDTAQMLRTDTDQISDMLRSAGIQVDGITVRAASPDFVSTSAGSTPSFFDQQSQSQSQSGGAQSDARGFGSQRRGDDPSQSFGRSGNFGQDDENRSQRRSGSGLYV